MENKNEQCRKDYSVELSQKVVGLMKLFMGKSLGNFPIQCVTKWMEGTLLEVERGVVAMSIKVRPEMTNPAGYLHGGTQSAMLDDAMGTACATLGYETAFLSTNLNIDYLGTAASGDTVTVKASVFREGNSLMHVVGEIKKDDTVIAKGQSNVFISNQPADYVNFMKRFSL
jgi:acyl-CoA thioesterase